MEEGIKNIKVLVKNNDYEKALNEISYFQENLYNNSSISEKKVKKYEKVINKLKKKSLNTKRQRDLNHEIPEFFTFTIPQDESVQFSLFAHCCEVRGGSNRGCLRGFWVITNKKLYFSEEGPSIPISFTATRLSLYYFPLLISDIIELVNHAQIQLLIYVTEKDKNGIIQYDRNGKEKQLFFSLIVLKRWDRTGRKKNHTKIFNFISRFCRKSRTI